MICFCYLLPATGMPYEWQSFGRKGDFELGVICGGMESLGKQSINKSPHISNKLAFGLEYGNYRILSSRTFLYLGINAMMGRETNHKGTLTTPFPSPNSGIFDVDHFGVRSSLLANFGMKWDIRSVCTLGVGIAPAIKLFYDRVSGVNYQVFYEKKNNVKIHPAFDATLRQMWNTNKNWYITTGQRYGIVVFSEPQGLVSMPSLEVLLTFGFKSAED